MNISDGEILNEMELLEKENLHKALHYLRKYGSDTRKYLAQCVAAICDVDVEKMLTNTDVIYLAHARWLYWYAYRYLTNESYEKIAINTSTMGHPFALRSVQGAVNKMAMMIEKEPMWKKRWTIIKHIIKLQDGESANTNVDNTIVIQVPKELKDKINITIKEK